MIQIIIILCRALFYFAANIELNIQYAYTCIKTFKEYKT